MAFLNLWWLEKNLLAFLVAEEAEFYPLVFGTDAETLTAVGKMADASWYLATSSAWLSSRESPVTEVAETTGS
jgi:hypothetical protein